MSEVNREEVLKALEILVCHDEDGSDRGYKKKSYIALGIIMLII